MTWELLAFALAACAGLLAGCSGSFLEPHRVIAQRTPTVKGDNGGSAELDLIACPKPGDVRELEDALNALLGTLEAEGYLATADGGTAKLTINLCPKEVFP